MAKKADFSFASVTSGGPGVEEMRRFAEIANRLKRVVKLIKWLHKIMEMTPSDTLLAMLDTRECLNPDKTVSRLSNYLLSWYLCEMSDKERQSRIFASPDPVAAEFASWLDANGIVRPSLNDPLARSRYYHCTVHDTPDNAMLICSPRGFLGAATQYVRRLLHSPGTRVNSVLAISLIPLLSGEVDNDSEQSPSGLVMCERTIYFKTHVHPGYEDCYVLSVNDGENFLVAMSVGDVATDPGPTA